MDPELVRQYLRERGLPKSRAQTTPDHPSKVPSTDVTKKKLRIALRLDLIEMLGRAVDVVTPGGLPPKLKD